MMYDDYAALPAGTMLLCLDELDDLSPVVAPKADADWHKILMFDADRFHVGVLEVSADPDPIHLKARLKYLHPWVEPPATRPELEAWLDG